MKYSTTIALFVGFVAAKDCGCEKANGDTPAYEVCNRDLPPTRSIATNNF